MLTVAKLAARTGISPSALRFYDRKGLLVPAGRSASGYRMYPEAQIGEALLVNSLREAGVGVAEIRAFLDADAPERARLLGAWRREAAARALSIRIAERYLGGLGVEEPQVHLFRWDRPAVLVWRAVEAPAGPLPFVAEAAAWQRTVERSCTVLDAGYVRTLGAEHGRVWGEVGVRIEPGRRPDARVEPTEPRVFATLECGVHDDVAAHRLFQLLHSIGLVPRHGLERYLPGELDRYQLLVAVVPR